MQQELIDSYYHFVREVVAKGVVYCLKDEKEYVASVYPLSLPQRMMKK